MVATRVRKHARQAFGLRDLAVLATCLLVAGTLLLSLAGANRDVSQAQVCADHLRQLYDGMTAYVNQYNSYPPHNPYPNDWWPAGEPTTIGGYQTGRWDPNLGWILTYGLGLEPPERFSNGHFKWHLLNPDELPEVVTCPAANLDLMFTMNPELDDVAPLESFVYQYAAFYQTSGVFRSATRVVGLPSGSRPGVGGRNPAMPDPRSSMSRQPVDNAQFGYPYVYVCQRSNSQDPNDPTWGNEYMCWIQAVHPAEVQSPSTAYYLADTREYRPAPPATTYNWPPATNNDGWPCGWGNKVYLGSRHFGFPNVLYLDGAVTRDDLTHVSQWNQHIDPNTGQIYYGPWRCATFATTVPLADIQTQVHTMPVLMVRGWEDFFNADGVMPR